MRCDVCGVDNAIILQRHTGRYLCSKCFIDDVKIRILDEVRRYEMFRGSDKLLLALSGGKDSFVLFDVVSSIHDVSRLGVITVVEGIVGYSRDEDITWILSRCKELGVDYVKTSIKDELGFSLTEIVDLSNKLGVDVSPCTYCGMIRRRIINKYA
ncbi:MAG: TIGR00269 family protein, partial [Sulfolobales archaeon]